MCPLVCSTAVRDAIIDRAREDRPAEVCGVLGGQFAADRSVVTSQYPAENVASTPRTRYAIDPEEQYAIFTRLENRGEDIVGFYHSHPRGPDEPSETDVTQAAWPDRSYVIVSLEGSTPTVGSWRWRETETGNRFERERIVFE